MSTYMVYMGIIIPSTIIIPIVFALYKYNSWSLSAKLCFSYLLLSATFNAFAIITAIKKINNLPALHLYTILEFCILCLVFKSFYKKGTLVRKWFTLAAFIFPFFAIGYIFSNNSLYTFNVLPRFLSSISLLIFCLIFLFSSLREPEKVSASFNLMAVVGLLVYFPSSSVLFGLIEYVRVDTELNRWLWCIHATLVLLMYLIFAYAYYKIPS